MSELITSNNLDDVIAKNIYLESEIRKQVMMIKTNQSIMKVSFTPQLAFDILKTFGLVQLPIDDQYISGAIYVKEGKMIPYINTSLPRANQYFAAWHEVYHLFFDKVSFDHFIEIDNIMEERKAECFAANMLLYGLDHYYSELKEEDFISRVFCCMSVFQTPYKAILISLYEYALKSANEGLKDKIKGVFDLKFDDMPKRFRSLGLDDSLVLPSNVINITPLQEKIRLKEKMNPELSYHKDNEDYLKNIIKEMELLVREK